MVREDPAPPNPLPAGSAQRRSDQEAGPRGHGPRGNRRGRRGPERSRACGAGATRGVCTLGRRHGNQGAGPRWSAEGAAGAAGGDREPRGGALTATQESARVAHGHAEVRPRSRRPRTPRRRPAAPAGRGSSPSTPRPAPPRGGVGLRLREAGDLNPAARRPRRRPRSLPSRSRRTRRSRLGLSAGSWVNSGPLSELGTEQVK